MVVMLERTRLPPEAAVTLRGDAVIRAHHGETQAPRQQQITMQNTLSIRTRDRSNLTASHLGRTRTRRAPKLPKIPAGSHLKTPITG